jgi:hypothetical protein
LDNLDLLFYDIEVFSQNALVVFKDINKKLVKVFHNNFVHLAALIQGKTLVGFNNYHYDDLILTYMLEQKSVQQIKALNDKIINGDKVTIKPRFPSLDCFQQCDVSNPSLKKIEGNMGRMILESSIPFTIDRALTNKEFDEVLGYCSYDVDTTIDIWHERVKSYFQPKFSLVEMLGKPEAIRWNTTTISANLLMNKPAVKWSNIRVEEELLDLVPAEVKEMWLEKAHSYTGEYSEGIKKTFTMEAFDNEIQFGFGGLHGAHKKKKKFKRVKLLDVKSMYPTIILILNCLGTASEKYKAILEKRLAVKNIDPVLSEALKLILNSVYGNLNNQYSLLYNPKAALSVCIYGQIALFELCKRVAPFVEIVNINTDGIAFIPHDESYIPAYQEWEKEFSLELEEKDFAEIMQKDVNNYVAVKANGSLVCKGADVNRYEKDAVFKNNNARIVDIALVNFLVNGTDVLRTITENLDNPKLFQYILKAGNTYQGTFSEQGESFNKVNRVFAAKKEGFCLYKKRWDEGLVRFPDAPMKQYLFNQDCSELEDFENIVDINHYYQLVMKKLERWT